MAEKEGDIIGWRGYYSISTGKGEIMPVGDLVVTNDLITADKMNAKLESVVNADVEASAAIAESKLSLTYGTSALKILIDGKMDSLTVDKKTGSDCSGSDGEVNRTLTLSSTPATIVLISIQGAIQYVTTDYTLTDDTITFLNKVWNDQIIEVVFY